MNVPGLRAFAGYAGWGEGQLEREIRGGGWLPGDVKTELIFETKAAQVWSHAYQLQGTTPLSFTSRTVGSA
jgi:putative transcriptional regulator